MVFNAKVFTSSELCKIGGFLDGKIKEGSMFEGHETSGIARGTGARRRRENVARWSIFHNKRIIFWKSLQDSRVHSMLLQNHKGPKEENAYLILISRCSEYKEEARVNDGGNNESRFVKVATRVSGSTQMPPCSCQRCGQTICRWKLAWDKLAEMEHTVELDSSQT